jgi:hypothetical protein
MSSIVSEEFGKVMELTVAYSKDLLQHLPGTAE